jgi:hypothetical protein
VSIVAFPDLKRILARRLITSPGRTVIVAARAPRISLTRVQARFPQVASIVDCTPALRLSEIVLLEMKSGGRSLMTADEGGLRWVKAEELQAYVETCREALASGEALLEELRLLPSR